MSWNREQVKSKYWAANCKSFYYNVSTAYVDAGWGKILLLAQICANGWQYIWTWRMQTTSKFLQCTSGVRLVMEDITSISAVEHKTYMLQDVIFKSEFCSKMLMYFKYYCNKSNTLNVKHCSQSNSSACDDYIAILNGLYHDSIAIWNCLKQKKFNTFQVENVILVHWWCCRCNLI